MKFEEALKHLREGHWIKRKCWVNSYLCTIYVYDEVPQTKIMISDGEQIPYQTWHPDYKDIMSEDWEVLSIPASPAKQALLITALENRVEALEKWNARAEDVAIERTSFENSDFGRRLRDLEKSFADLIKRNPVLGKG